MARKIHGVTGKDAGDHQELPRKREIFAAVYAELTPGPARLMPADKQVILEIMPNPAPASPAPAPAPALELDTATRLRAALGRLSRRLRPTEAGAAAGLTPTRVTILLTVVRAGPTRLSELAEAEGINPTMLSRAISGLVDAGLLERTCDAGDRRSAWVQSTAAGRQLAERMRTERTDAVKLALGGLGDDDREALERALPALEALAEQLKGRRP
jgi:DNA-binding MarR family transcriptional regulator